VERNGNVPDTGRVAEEKFDGHTFVPEMFYDLYGDNDKIATLGEILCKKKENSLRTVNGLTLAERLMTEDPGSVIQDTHKTR